MHSFNSTTDDVTVKPKLKRASNAEPPQAKRRRRAVLSPPPERQYQHLGSLPSTPRKNAASTTIQDKQSPVKLPTSEECWKWTFTKASVAPCFISDVLRLTDGKQKGDYFMLGRVPCRSISIIGLVLGATAYEKRTLYIVDDGTGIINCIMQHPEQPPQSPKKDGQRAKRKRTSSEGQGKSRSPGPDDESKMPYSKAGDANAENAELERGYVIRITGIVRSWKGSKEIQVDEMERCTSINDELEHWQRVLTLHKEHYDLTEPFIIPPPPIPAALARAAYSPKKLNHPRQASSALPALSTPKKRPLENVDPRSPSGHSVTYFSPSKSIVSSPSRSYAGPASPIRLRNPSRLRTRELTVNTFRIYVKHYMDNTLPPEPVTLSEVDGDGGSDTSDADSVCISLGLGSGGRDDSTTRTPRKRLPGGPRDIESTPRAKAYDSNWTPKAAYCNRDDEDEGSQAPHVLGFTLSYLRRVPELSELARRVVKAEAQRREKELHFASQEKSTVTANPRSSHRSDKGKGMAYESSSKHGKEGLRPKMKRLFVVAIRKLFEEGSIVLWDGPVWPIVSISAPTSRCRSQNGGELTALSGNASISTGDASVSTNASLSTTYSTRGGDGIGESRDEGELSDPQVGEESYIPLTPSYLGTQVLSIIRAMTSSASTTSRHRHNAGKKEVRDARSRGPTKEEITKYLNRMNSRWERVGAWSVQEALEWLQQEGRVQIMRDMDREGNDAGRVRWGLCF